MQTAVSVAAVRQARVRRGGRRARKVHLERQFAGEVHVKARGVNDRSLGTDAAVSVL